MRSTMALYSAVCHSTCYVAAVSCASVPEGLGSPRWQVNAMFRAYVQYMLISEVEKQNAAQVYHFGSTVHCCTVHFYHGHSTPIQCQLAAIFPPVCRAPRPPPQRYSGCTALWEGACSAPSSGTSCWWSQRRPTTGCSTVCRAASPTRVYGDTVCLASATCRRTASVSSTTHGLSATHQLIDHQVIKLSMVPYHGIGLGYVMYVMNERQFTPKS